MKITHNTHQTHDQAHHTAKNVVHFKEYKPRQLKRACNLCSKEFHPTSKFERFCEECKTESELYHFAEWLSA